MITNSNYVGSGVDTPKNAKPTEVIRYDYFETPVKINNGDYIVAFDVEVLPTRNNYRTHKVINEIDLISVDSADVAPTATAPENRTGLSDNNVAQSEAEVNTTETPTAEEFQQTVNEAAEEPAPAKENRTEETNTAEPKVYEKPELKSKLNKQYDRAVKEFTYNLYKLFNIPGGRDMKAEFKADIDNIAAAAFEAGSVDADAVSDLISRMWDAGQIYENYVMDMAPELRKYFKKTGIQVSDTIKGDITDYADWKKIQRGFLKITDNGTPVDVLYQELSEQYPALFPEDIINPTEQLMHMAEIRQQMRETTYSNSDLYTDEQRTEIGKIANGIVDTLERKMTGIATESRGEVIPGYTAENLASLDAQDTLNQDPDWISLQQQEPVVETEGEKLKNWKETTRRVRLTSQVLDMTRHVKKAAKTAQPELRAKMIEKFGTIVPYFKGMSDGKRIDLKKQIDDLDRFRREVPGAKQYVWDAETGTYKVERPSKFGVLYY